MRKRKNRNNNNKCSVLDNQYKSTSNNTLDHFDKPEDIVVGFKNRLKPRSINQKDYIRNIAENTITFCEGVPGSGKTHIAIGMALEYLIDQKVKKIVITRPVVEAGEKLGFLPGTAEEKLHPYLLPLFDEIDYFLKPQHFGKLKHTRQIEIVPLGLMRGRSFHNAFIVADECQNASYDQLKMLLTRIGIDSKMVLTGDLDQSDLERYNKEGFRQIIERLNGVNSIGFSKLEISDIVRNPIIADIVDKL
ncbi:MAG: PhoH family protein [Alphaproteobacteria bacterium]|nr:PhoH family protein [Alphaproteobacteria bacterium]